MGPDVVIPPSSIFWNTTTRSFGHLPTHRSWPVRMKNRAQLRPMSLNQKTISRPSATRLQVREDLDLDLLALLAKGPSAAKQDMDRYAAFSYLPMSLSACPCQCLCLSFLFVCLRFYVCLSISHIYMCIYIHTGNSPLCCPLWGRLGVYFVI